MTIDVCKDFEKITEFLKGITSSPTHWPEWNQIISKHYSTEFYYLTWTQKAEILGICPVHEQKQNFLVKLSSGQFMYIPYGGWLFKSGQIAEKQHFPYRINKSVSVFSLPFIHEFPRYQFEESQIVKQTLVIDLKPCVSEIWDKEIDSKRRNMIRKAEKNQLAVTEVGRDNFNRYYEFYTEVNSRYDLVNLKKDCLHDLLFTTNYINFKAYYVEIENQIISSIVVAYDKDYAIYLFGHNSKGMPNLGQGELMQWKVIQEVKENGCRYYDLCYIEKERLPHIYEFKRGFSNNEVTVLNFEVKSTPYKILNKLLKWKSKSTWVA